MTELVRYEAARRALAEAVAVDEVVDIRSKAEAMRVYARQASDKGLEIQAAQIRFRAERRLGELIVAQKETVGLNTGSRGQLQGKSDSGGAVVEQPEDERPRLADIGVDRKLSSKAQKLAAMDMAEFERALARHREEMESGAGRVAMDLLKIDAEEKGRVHRRDLSSALASASALTPSGKKYPASYSDPPWVRKAGVGNRAYENHYATMPWPEILKYLERVGEAMQPDAWHWMWIPRAHLLARVPYKIEVMLADGEVVMATADLPLAYACQLALGMDSYSTCYVWTKTDEEHPDESGTGLLVWDQDELLLQFKRGRGLPKPGSDEKFGSNHRERKREHSRKPDHYRHMIATMVGKDSDGAPLPVLELFARVDAEHPLPQNWDAWGNQAGVALQGSAIADPTDAAPSPSAAGGTETVILSGYGVDRLKQREWAGDVGAVDDDGEPPAQSDDIRGLWTHPAIQGRHVVSNTRDGEFSVATCQCGWGFRAQTAPDGWQLRDDAIDNHWREIVAQHDLPEPSGETEAAAAEATDGASAAAAVADVGASVSSPAPYDAGGTIVIDQLAGSEWLAPAPFDSASLGECEALQILSDFCHQRRDIAPDLGEFYRARGFSYFGGKEWSLTGKGWDRLRELQAEALPASSRVELTEPFRAPQMNLFDAARQLDDAPPAEVVDGALQTRLPVDADELAEQLALLAVDAGGPIDGAMARHLVGKDFLFATTRSLKITETGRAFLAQLVRPAAAGEEART